MNAVLHIRLGVVHDLALVFLAELAVVGIGVGVNLRASGIVPADDFDEVFPLCAGNDVRDDLRNSIVLAVA